MLLFFLLLFLGIPEKSVQRRLSRYRIPFEYLITRNSSNETFLNEKEFTIETALFIENFCGNVNCYAAVFRNENKTEYYQMIRELPNNGLSDSYGLQFNDSNYLYSIAFLVEQDPFTCEKDQDYLRYRVASCLQWGDHSHNDRDGPNYNWFNYTRTNGRVFCYTVNTVGNTRDGKIVKCEKLNANITGFQTNAERDFIYNTFLVKNCQSKQCYEAVFIASKKNESASKCSEKEGSGQDCNRAAYQWDPQVPLSGQREQVPFRETDLIDNLPAGAECLALHEDSKIRDRRCDENNPVLCGQYADLLFPRKSSLGELELNIEFSTNWDEDDSSEESGEPGWFQKIFFPHAAGESGDI